MTNEEAIKIVTEWRDAFKHSETGEAFEMAIEALEAKEEKEKDQIRVGDEVEYEKLLYAVTKITGDESHVMVIHTSGDVGAIPIDACHKTGRHFPEVAEVLKKMEAGE